MSGDMLFDNGRSVYPKGHSTIWTPAKVLITVKTAPVPSTAHGDTVCVAGIRLTPNGPEWIRLYPIPFRHLDSTEKFRKYQIVDVPVVPAAGDPRSESFKPDRAKIQVGAFLPPWKARHPHVMPLADEWTMCGIQRALKAKQPSPSLAVIRPARVIALDIELKPDWSPEERAKLELHLNQEDLFGAPASAKALESPRFQGWYRYVCEEPDCNGHRQGMLDWEFIELQRRHQFDPEDVAIAAIRARFFTAMCDPARGPLFFVGNQAKRQQTFSVLGVYRSIAKT